MSPFFSIIVPIYNCEKYLKTCVESVIIQEFSDWELILVDDGSTDGSSIICDEYAQKDNRIKTIHKQNGGEFSSRKVGLDIATGQYIVGLDADDYYLSSHLNMIYHAFLEYEVDCVSFPLRYVGESEGVEEPIFPYDRMIDGRQFLVECLKKTCSFCNKAIKKTCFEKVDYSDAPPARYSEDEMMVLPALCYVESACCKNISSYCYRIHDESASNKKDFSHIIYRDYVLKYDIDKMVEANVYSGEIEAILIKQFLHMLNCRIWELYMTDQWKMDMKDSVEKLELFELAKKKFTPKDFGLKERIRVGMILDGHYGVLSILSKVLRVFRGIVV